VADGGDFDIRFSLPAANNDPNEFGNNQKSIITVTHSGLNATDFIEQSLDPNLLRVEAGVGLGDYYLYIAIAPATPASWLRAGDTPPF
jgi:hypothetical protein